MKLYLLRHAQRGHGEQQDSVTDVGIEQAKRTARYFSQIKIDKVICSSADRCKKTAEMMLKDKDYDVEYTSEVKEQSLGIFEGKSGKEWKEAIKNSNLSEENFRPTGGENRKDAYERAKKFYLKLRKEKVEKLLVISHSGFISDLITLILKFPEKENVNFKTGFCAISFFDLDKNFEAKSFSIGCLTHLANV